MKYIWMIILGLVWLYVLFDMAIAIKNSLESCDRIDLEDWICNMSDFTLTWVVINVILFSIISLLVWVYSLGA